MQRQFPVSFTVPGTLAADVPFIFVAPDGCQLVEVSAVATNPSDAQLKIGDDVDDARSMVFKDIGDNSIPVVFGRQDFVGTEFPVYQKGQIVVATLDFDGAAGTAANNVTLLMTFTVS